DGKRLAVLARNSSSLVLDGVEDGKELTSAKTREHTYLVAYSPDGKVLNTGAATGVQMWDPDKCRPVAQDDSAKDTDVRSFAFLPGNKVLALGDCGKALRLWDVRSGRERTPTSGHKAPINTLAFSRDGKSLLTGGGDGVRTWATTDWKEVRHFELRGGERGWPYYHLSPDGRYALSI